MPIITVTTWPSASPEKNTELMLALTNTVREVTGAPLDKITVYIDAIAKDRWCEGGSIATDPDFPSKSRRSH